jgi:pilus assembly protein CpaF
LQDPTISDILVNGCSQVYVERAGVLEATSVRFHDNAHLLRIIDRIVSQVGRRVDESNPMVDARLLDGSRVNAIIPPLAVDGPLLSIRRFGTDRLMPADLVDRLSLTPGMMQLLEAAVRARLNIMVSGGTGAGKTTLLNGLSAFISPRERIVTIEDAAELQLKQPHLARLETRPANVEGHGTVRQRQLLVNALRMRPDRIIIGEVRGPEAFDMLQAMNTGHAGSMTTVHANSPRELLGRLETMVMMGGVELPQRAIREQIVLAVGLLVQLQRLPGGGRVVSSITELQGMEGDTVLLQDIFTRADITDNGGRLVPTGLRPKILDELALNGVEVSPSVFRKDVDSTSLLGQSRQSGRHRPSRPGRVEPPPEEVYEALARRRDGR